MIFEIVLWLSFFKSASDQHESQKMCGKVVSEYPFMLKYFPDKTQKCVI